MYKKCIVLLKVVAMANILWEKIQSIILCFLILIIRTLHMAYKLYKKLSGMLKHLYMCIFLIVIFLIVPSVNTRRIIDECIIANLYPVQT